jgi:hypothetical protein
VGIIGLMPGRKKPKDRDPLDPYRRVRKPIAPPERVIPDRRRKLREEESKREAEEDREK